jgi:hypothetical protein
MTALHQGLGETGYIEGQNVTIEYRWAEDRNDLLLALAADIPRPASASRLCRKRSASANDAGISADGSPVRRA